MPVVGRPWSVDSSNLIVSRQRTTFVVNETRLKSLFSTPLLVLSGRAGLLIQPIWMHFRRLAGTAYTLNGSAAIGFYYGATAVTTINNTPLLTGTTEVASVLYYFASTISTTLFATGTGTNLTFANDVADLTLGTGNLEVTLVFDLVPFNMSQYV